ncbi:hypothetical protein HPQ64_09735 [Rhizobiales bacterium]|nr:hypothetical protein [Hongsoonwoonella zoysiae]
MHGFFDLLNQNQGVLTLSLFVATILIGWISGIFKALRQRPRLLVKLIDGPTFCCTFLTGRKHKNFDTHRTGIALYLNISNLGSAPTSITSIEVGYHWHLRPLSMVWLKFRIGWFWIKHQSISLDDFQADIGDSVKIFPFLTQRNRLSPSESKTYLRIGESTNGVVYFEQEESWGGCFPHHHKGKTKIKLLIKDTSGKKYYSIHKIPIINLEEAKKYNPRFGETLAEIHGEFLTTREIEIKEASERTP